MTKQASLQMYDSLERVGFSHSDEFYEGLLSEISLNTDNRPSNVCVDRENRPIPDGRGVVFVCPSTPQSRLFAD